MMSMDFDGSRLPRLEPGRVRRPGPVQSVRRRGGDVAECVVEPEPLPLETPELRNGSTSTSSTLPSEAANSAVSRDRRDRR
jgi:hypothetical protein